MAFYGQHGYSFVQQSDTFGVDISNANHDTGLQNGWTYTTQVTVDAGMYVVHAHYSPAQGSGDFPNGDEDQYSIGVSKNGSVQNSHMTGREGTPVTHLRSGSRMWVFQETSSFTLRVCVRQGDTDGDAGGTRGRLYWTIHRIGEYT
tara:strand:- start:1421 stop:1858 length:438 start_codon:yes stop_codon:yes gene_type:complete